MQQLDSFWVWLQVMQVLDAMPSSNLKPEDDEAKLEADRKYRTTYMFSATMPPTVERLAKKYLRRPVTITIGSAGRATDNVTQRVMLIKVGQGASKAPYQQRRLQDPCKLPSLRPCYCCTSAFRGPCCTRLHVHVAMARLRARRCSPMPIQWQGGT